MHVLGRAERALPQALSNISQICRSIFYYEGCGRGERQASSRKPEPNAYRKVGCVRSGKSACAELSPSAKRIARRTLREFVEQYARERNHQGVDNPRPVATSMNDEGPVKRRERLGGMLNFYSPAGSPRPHLVPVHFWHSAPRTPARGRPQAGAADLYALQASYRASTHRPPSLLENRLIHDAFFATTPGRS